MIYLDYAAATPVDKKVLATMEPYMTSEFFNPSAVYSPARKVREAYEDARHRIAQTIGAKPTEIIFTSGATESINLAILGFLNGLAKSPNDFSASVVPSKRSEPGDIPMPLRGGDPVARSAPLAGKTGDETKKCLADFANAFITTAVEHLAVLECAKAVGGVVLPVDVSGRVNIDELKSRITDETRLVSVQYANNEVGTVQDIKAIAQIVAQERARRAEKGFDTPLWLHSDASQAAGYLDLNVARLGVDMMTLNSGKCYGPKGVGLLYVRAGVEITPLIRGGGQENGLRSGTENVAGVVGFAKALEIAEKKRSSEVKRLSVIQQKLEKYLISDIFCEEKINKESKEYIKSDILGVEIVGSKKHKLPNIVNFTVAGLDAERAVFALDERGIYVSTGSACAANKGTGSHVLRALGLSESEQNGSIRISMGRHTTEAEIEKLKPILREVIENERKLS